MNNLNKIEVRFTINGKTYRNDIEYNMEDMDESEAMKALADWIEFIKEEVD